MAFLQKNVTPADSKPGRESRVLHYLLDSGFRRNDEPVHGSVPAFSPTESSEWLAVLL